MTQRLDTHIRDVTGTLEGIISRQRKILLGDKGNVHGLRNFRCQNLDDT